MTLHPELDEDGKPVALKKPSTPSPLSAWLDPSAIATVIPGGPLPDSLGGIAFAPWQPPATNDGWKSVPGRKTNLVEPKASGFGRITAAGAIIIEADGRVWLMSPSNGHGGYLNTFPKGKVENLDLQGTAIKEAFEETGLKIEIIGFVADSKRTTSTARYYLARRVGGTPSKMGWEAQAVHLVPAERLSTVLNSPVDKALAMKIAR